MVLELLTFSATVFLGYFKYAPPVVMVLLNAPETFQEYQT
jgi:hypothetical protein